MKISAAIDIIQKAKAKHWAIVGKNAVIRSRFDDNSHTVDLAINELTDALEDIDGGYYTIEYWQDKNNPGKSLYGIEKVAVYVDKPTIGNAIEGIGYTPDMGLQKQVWNLEKQIEIAAIEAKYQKEIDKLKSAEDTGSPWMEKIGAIAEQFLPHIMKQNQPHAKGSVPTSARVQNVPSEEIGTVEEEKMVSALNRLESLLGPEKLAEGLTKLADRAESNPSQFNNLMTML